MKDKLPNNQVHKEFYLKTIREGWLNKIHTINNLKARLSGFQSCDGKTAS